MKKTYLLMAAFFAACASSLSVKAQTDVTATYLTNAGFDTAPICYTVAGGATLNSSVTRIGTTGYIYPIPGWTNACVINSNAVQVATGEYGIKTTNAQGFNNVLPPTSDKNGVTTGACLAMSAGWGDKAIYNQSVSMPAGRYALKLDVYNSFTVAAINANYCGFVPTTGTATYSKRLSFPLSAWVTDSISFYLTDQTAGVINLGFTTSANGSGNGAKVFVDNVRLIYYGIDKSGMKALMDSATVIINNPHQDVGTSTVYTDLNTAIANAQVVYNNAAATAIDVVNQETALKTAISNLYSAILLQSRINTWTTFPSDVTSVIVNQGFESGFTGWTNPGGFGVQTNTSFTLKVGTNYVEKWIASPGTLKGLILSQNITNIPNGIYSLTASAQAIQQTATPTYPGGAFLFANNDSTQVFATKDYSVTTRVTNNTLNIGFKVDSTGNWVSVDNFRLSYVSNGSPYLLITPTTLSFSPFTNQKTVNVKGGNLTSDVALSATSSFSLSNTSIAAADAMAATGVDVVVISNATKALPNDSLIITSGTARQKVQLTVAETMSSSNKGLFFDQSVGGATAMTAVISGDLFSNVALSAPAGITLSDAFVTSADANTGKTITATWDQQSRIENKYIYLTSGVKKDSMLVFAVNDNMISKWDGDTAVVVSKLTDFGWSQTLADGVTAGPAAFGSFATTGTRYVTAANAAHTYHGQSWVGNRVAYLRTWGSPATNVFNLPVNLEANKTYVFRGVAAWHNNETNPTFTIAVNTATANLGTTLGSQSVAFTVVQQAQDYGFEFTPTTTATHYLTVSSNTVNDAMCGIDFLAIYPKEQTLTDILPTDISGIQVYPTVTDGSFNVNLGDKSGLIKVYDVAGKLILAKTATSSIETIALPSTGMYVVEVKSAGVTKTVKVIKVK